MQQESDRKERYHPLPWVPGALWEQSELCVENHCYRRSWYPGKYKRATCELIKCSKATPAEMIRWKRFLCTQQGSELHRLNLALYNVLYAVQSTVCFMEKIQKRCQM